MMRSSLRRVCLPLLIALAFAAAPRAALADCTSPAGIEGQMVWNFATHLLNMCDGTTWLTAGGSGGGSSSGTAGYVQLSGGSGAFADSGTTAGQQFFWDNTNKRLGIGTATPNTNLTIANANSSATLTNFTQALTNGGINILSSYTSDTYTPGIFWSASNDNATKPKAGIWTEQTDAEGSKIHIGTSSNYATGITKSVMIDSDGSIRLATGTFDKVAWLYATTSPSDAILTLEANNGYTTTATLELASNNYIAAKFNGSEKFRVAVDGKVGIGNTAPTDLLTVGTGGYIRTQKSFAGAPTAGDCNAAAEVGRMTYDTTNNRWYVCTSASGWVYTAMGTSGGGGSSSGAAGYLQLSGGSGAFSSDSTTNGQLYWDSTNHRLGIGTTTFFATRLQVTDVGDGASTVATVRRAATTGGNTQNVGFILDAQNAIFTLDVSGTGNSAATIRLGAGTTNPIVTMGNAGIGTTTPTDLLDVGSGGYVRTQKNFAGAPTAGDCDNAAEVGRMTYDTTNNRWYVCTSASGWVYTAMGTSGGASSSGAAGYIQFSNGSSGFSSDSTSGGEFYWDSTNHRLGIGTTAPSYNLSFGTASGNSSLGINRRGLAGTGYDLSIIAGGTAVGSTDYSGGNLVLSSGTATGTGSSNIYIKTAAAGTTGTTDRAPTTSMTILGSGNVGIGTTTPGSLLQVASTGYAQFSKGFAGAPTASDCDNAAEVGRMTYDTTNNRWYVCTSASGWVYTAMGTSGASTALSALTAAASTNTIDNAANTQTWNWNSLTTGNGLVLGSTSMTSGNLMSVSVNAGTAILVSATSSYGVRSTVTDGNAVYGAASVALGMGGRFVGVAGGYGVMAVNTGNTAGTYALYCQSTYAQGCGGNQNWTNASDVRLKERIADLPDERGLEAVMKLRPVTYHWKDKKLDEGNGQRLGLIAQEVEAVFPESVGVGNKTEIDLGDGKSETVEGTKNLAYSDLVVPLIKAVQELKASNDNLRATVEAQGREIETLKAAR